MFQLKYNKNNEKSNRHIITHFSKPVNNFRVAIIRGVINRCLTVNTKIRRFH